MPSRGIVCAPANRDSRSGYLASLPGHYPAAAFTIPTHGDRDLRMHYIAPSPTVTSNLATRLSSK